MPSSRRPRLTPEATDDLRDLLQYTLETWGHRQRDVYKSRILRSVRHIARHPYFGRTGNELSPGLRGFPTARFNGDHSTGAWMTLTVYASVGLTGKPTRDRKLVWVGRSKEDLTAFPQEVRRLMGHALRLAQRGEKHENAKPLRGFNGAGVLEVVEDDDGDTYRTVYTVTLPDAVYVLHAFQKKSKSGIKTPQPDIDLIKQRLKAARQKSARRLSGH